MNPLSKTFLALLLVLLGACGGGSGDTSTEGSASTGGSVSGGTDGTGSGTGSQGGSTQLSTAKTMTAFSFGSVPATIDEARKTIDVTLPAETDVRNLVASFTTTGSQVTVGSAVQVSDTTAGDFSNPSIYTVTAADGSSVSYRVNVALAPSSAKAITAFSVAGTQASIDEANRRIDITVPYGTNLNAMAAAFTTTGALVRIGSAPQTSRYSVNNFSSTVVYTITAVDGSSVSYAVRVTVAMDSSKSIRNFSLVTPGRQQIAGSINEASKTIQVTVPYGTSPTSLVANYILNGRRASVAGVVQTSGTTANNFAAPVVYAVEAQDGSSANYTVTVSVAPPAPLAVMSTTPATNSTTGAPTAAVVVMFNKALGAATCTTANFKLSGGATGTVRCTGSAMTFTPNSALTLASNYTATVTTGLKDADGLSLAKDHVWSFKTRSEYSAPSVVGSAFSGTVVDTVVKIEFSESMNTSTINTATVTLDPVVEGVVTASGSTAAFTPSKPLAKGQLYTLKIAGVQDSVGNPLSPNYSNSFQTDPGSVVPIEYYGGGRFCNTSSFFSVQLVNETGVNQDVRLRIHNAANNQPVFFDRKNIPPGGRTSTNLNTTTNQTYADGVCYSNGQYTVTWTPTASPATPAQTRTYTSANWVPNAPRVDSCFLGGSIASPNCVNPLAAPPVVITPTTPVSTTAPAGTLGAETAPDDDGCYVPRHQPECLVVEKLAYDSFSSTQVNLRLRNNCTRRVYADFCLQLNSGKWDCGADGASPGGAITWWSFDAQPRAVYQYTGSTKASYDWVCHAKDPNLRAKFP